MRKILFGFYEQIIIKYLITVFLFYSSKYLFVIVSISISCLEFFEESKERKRERILKLTNNISFYWSKLNKYIMKICCFLLLFSIPSNHRLFSSYIFLNFINISKRENQFFSLFLLTHSILFLFFTTIKKKICFLLFFQLSAIFFLQLLIFVSLLLFLLLDRPRLAGQECKY